MLLLLFEVLFAELTLLNLVISGFAMWTRIVMLKPFLHAVVVEEVKTGKNAALRTRMKSFETDHAFCLLEDAWHPIERFLNLAI